MKPYITIIVTAAALVIGFIAGKFQASSSWGQIYAHGVYQRAGGDADLYTRVLAGLRSGHEADATSELERALDLSLFSLDHLSPPQRMEFQMTINQARAYRTKYPWPGSSPQIDESVQRVLK